MQQTANTPLEKDLTSPRRVRCPDRKSRFGDCDQQIQIESPKELDVADQYDRTTATGPMNMVVLDNIFIFVCAVLVLPMQVGFALVEAGLTRAKIAANIVVKNMMDVCTGMLVFGLLGWGIAYPGDFNGLVGSAGLGVAGLTNVFVDVSPESLGNDDFYPLAVPVDFLFQVAFAATAATIVPGAVAERTKFVGYIGFIDFAGSGVLILSSAGSASTPAHSFRLTWPYL